VRAAAELAVLTAGCLVLPPLLAFAAYFAAWHAARHTVRLALDHAGRLDRHRIALVLRDGLPSLAVATAGVVTLLVVGVPAPGVLWFGLAAVWGLTVPHTAAVTAFGRRSRDRRSG
jgi:hypothetical protein